MRSMWPKAEQPTGVLRSAEHITAEATDGVSGTGGKLNRTEIIQRYKIFFGLENMLIGENDQLIIDFVEELIGMIEHSKRKDHII